VSIESPIKDLQAIDRIFKVDGADVVLMRLQAAFSLSSYLLGQNGDRVGARAQHAKAAAVKTFRKTLQETSS
jgi:myo-inositol-hexaphosphate 3-phosphohydrolase